MPTFDVIIIGAGPGGYVCAIRAAQLGKSVALVEKLSSLGGTCLNVGCIPSKALLDSSEHFHQAQTKFEVHGIKVGKLELDWKRMLKRKDEVIEATVKGIDYLVKKNKIRRFLGTAAFVDAHTVSVTPASGEAETLRGNHIVIATGSEPTPLRGVDFDGERIISSTEALELPEVPKSMIVIGGGVIGVELGSVYARLGTEVTVLEYLDSVIPTMDSQLGKELGKCLKKIGMKLQLGVKVTGATVADDKVTVTAEDKKGKSTAHEADYCLVAIGRRPYSTGLNLAAAGIELDERGRIPVNEHLQTSQPHVYAIGDCVRGAMLAHKAEEEGVLVAELIDGQKPHIDYNCIPGVVYTWPEVASVGKTEDELKAAGVKYKAGSFPYKASGRARASEETDGFVKVLADAATDEVLGIHLIGPRASDLIGECVVAMEFHASAEDIGRICHAHPTFAEPIKEAALAATENRALHI